MKLTVISRHLCRDTAVVPNVNVPALNVSVCCTCKCSAFLCVTGAVLVLRDAHRLPRCESVANTTL